MYYARACAVLWPDHFKFDSYGPVEKAKEACILQYQGQLVMTPAV